MVDEKQIIGYRILKEKKTLDPKEFKPERFMFYTVDRDDFVKGVCYDSGSDSKFNKNIYYLPTDIFSNKADLLALDGSDFLKKVILLVIDKPFGSSETTYNIKIMDYKK